MAVALALLAAITWGSSDFLGGLTARRGVDHFAIAFGLQMSGLAVIVPALVIVPGALTMRGAVWGSMGGCVAAVGLVSFYELLGSKPMNVVAPITGVTAAVVPALVGILLGEHPGLLGFAGVAVGLAAIGLVSRSGEENLAASGRRHFAQPVDFVKPLLCGAAFGFFFIALKEAGTDSGAWPALFERLASVAMMVVVGVAWRRPLLVPRSAMRTVGIMGGVDAVGVVAYVFASHSGLLSLVAVLAALYPVCTALLATVVLHEKLSTPQRIGVGFGALSLAMIAASS